MGATLVNGPRSSHQPHAPPLSRSPASDIHLPLLAPRSLSGSAPRSLPFPTSHLDPPRRDPQISSACFTPSAPGARPLSAIARSIAPSSLQKPAALARASSDPSCFLSLLTPSVAGSLASYTSLPTCMDPSGPGPSSAVGVGDAPAAAMAPPPPRPAAAQQQLSRYESQKRRDWNTFLQYLRNHRPPLTLARCSGAHVIEFLRYLDQFGKTKVHAAGCAYYGQPSPPGPCPCPLRQAWGSLDALIGRLRAAYEESGGTPESNPFAARAVRIYLREVRDSQAKARGIPYEKKKRKRAAAGEQASSSSPASAAAAGGSGSSRAAAAQVAGGSSGAAPSNT
ncbi:hypothetical protein HU200_025993 [Digitaria exilis]|uniref:ALOG domain-containing protein n=1 Tax=Digitaria exilis TaxID=1010633 RepID=A0A835BYZ6_9POAL|nr:hypothetical protein HU200_025993 [Digitaria exilis]